MRPTFCGATAKKRMAYLQLKTCLGTDEQALVAQKLGQTFTHTTDTGLVTEYTECIADQNCTDDQLQSMATAEMSGLQCATVSQICHMYSPEDYANKTKRQECINALSAGMCKASDTISSPAGSLPSCRSNYAANEIACSNLQSECNDHADLQAQLAALPDTATELQRSSLEQAVQAKAAVLSQCSTGYCETADKTAAQLEAVCAPIDTAGKCGLNNPCTWDADNKMCTVDAEATYQCHSFTTTDTCNAHNCTWNPRICKALPQDSLGCHGNATQSRCLAPDCQWVEATDVTPTQNLDEKTLDCVKHARKVTDTIIEDFTGTGSTGVPTTPCRMDPEVAASLDARVGGKVGTMLSQACPLFQQESTCEQYGCTWASDQTWKCTSTTQARLEPHCNAVRQYAQCEMLHGMCEPVEISTEDKQNELCAADCNWEAEASKYYNAGIAIGKYEVENHIKLGLDNVSNLMGYTEAFAQKPTAECPRVCDGLVLKMWLEEGMEYETKGARVEAGLSD